MPFINSGEMGKGIMLRPDMAQVFEQLLIERQAGIREQQRNHDWDWGLRKSGDPALALRMTPFAIVTESLR